LFVQCCSAALAFCGTVFLVGCGGGGGGSGSTAARPGEPVVLDSLTTGLPVCSTSSQGSLNGPTVAGTTASVTVSSTCGDATSNMRVWLAVNSTDTNITHYDWEIVGWKNQAPHGSLDKYDAMVDLDPVNGRYIVRTHGVNSVRYNTPIATQLAALTQPFSQQVSVTAWTEDGRFGTAYFTITLQPGGATVTQLQGSLLATDAPSHGRAGNTADYYRLTGSGSVTLSAEGLDTYIYVYDSNRNLITEADEGAANSGSRLALSLQSGQTYYLEVTGFALGATGNYLLTSTGGGLVGTTDPWAGSPAVASIAGNYRAVETTSIKLTYNGSVTTNTVSATNNTTVSQTGPSVRFQAVNPTGSTPNLMRYGTLSGNTLVLTGNGFLPTDPSLVVSTNSQTATGTVGSSQFLVNSSSRLQGTYKGLPLTAEVTSSATFTRQ
jgi:hypothetical protein